MKILVISSIFPNNMQQNKGTYVLQQLCELLKLCKLKVVAPVPFSLSLKAFKKINLYSKIENKQVINDIEVFHPRYLVIPKIGRVFYGYFYFLGIRKTVKNILLNFKFDTILSYFAFPDGFAAVLLAKILKIPVVIYVLGSDINLFIKNKFRKKLTTFAILNASCIISVSDDLKIKMLALGVSGDKIKVLRNGIDSLKFFPQDRDKCRESLKLPKARPIVLFVGNLREVKGVRYLIAAFDEINRSEKSNALLFLVGEGELREEIENKISKLNLTSNIKLVGEISHEKIPLWMNASDILCLPSLSEGYPNVVLEALCCGKPVVATSVGAIPEIVNSEENGFLIPSGDSQALSNALLKALKRNWDPVTIRNKVKDFTWKRNSEELFRIIQRTVGRTG